MASIVSVSTSAEDDLIVADGHGSHRIKAAWLPALRAHVQAEQDAERGRWRDTKNSNFVVYLHSKDEVYVVDEASGCWGGWHKSEAAREAGQDQLAAAAARYFEAHDPRYLAAHDAIWEALEPRLEDVIDLDLNVPVQNERFASLVADVARAVVKGEKS